MYWTSGCGRIELKLTRTQVGAVSQPGVDATPVVEDLLRMPSVRTQLTKLAPDVVAAVLEEYGAWNTKELTDHEANLKRLLWIAGCDLNEHRPGC